MVPVVQRPVDLLPVDLLPVDLLPVDLLPVDLLPVDLLPVDLKSRHPRSELTRQDRSLLSAAPAAAGRNSWTASFPEAHFRGPGRC
jgi:hypothetical protein